MTCERRSGVPFVVAAPSGTGKTTVCSAVCRADAKIGFSVSHTTRRQREGERDGVDYHFVTPAEFRKLTEEDGFLEHAEYGGQNYGTSRSAVRALTESGQDALLDIEVQGARQVRERCPDAKLIFLLPPSMKALEQRLRARGTDSEDAIHRRLSVADEELKAVGIFHYAVVNDSLEEAVAAVLEIVAAERRGDPQAVAARHGRERVVARWKAAQDSL